MSLPFWLGGPLLALPTVAYFVVFRRSLGVSGALGRVLHMRRTMEEDRVADAMEDEDELLRALDEATRAEFGEVALDVGPTKVAHENRGRPLRLFETCAFLVAFLIGGGVASRLVSAPRGLRIDASMVAATGSELRAWLALLFGSVLVGFGARLSAGCTSGHGLSGCARRSPASWAATAIFFAVAVVTALAIRRLS